MKGILLSLRRLACCMSLEPTAEPGERVSTPSLVPTRSPSRSPNQTIPALAQEGTRLSRKSTRSSTLERVAARSFPNYPSTSWGTLSRSTSPSSTSTRPSSQSSNKSIPAYTQEASYISGITRRSSTPDDFNERLAASSISSTSKRSLPQPERPKSPQRTTEIALCSFERLPVEIQTCILAESSLGSLRALIRSSPRFYYVYSQNRLPLLKRALICALDGIFQDAYAACRSDSDFAYWTGTPWLSVDDYLESPDTAPSASVIDGLSFTVAQQMASFHLRVVEPLTERYARWALGALSSSAQDAPLTKTEKSRIQRAMYRLQVICNSGTGNEQQILQVIDSFGPWAAEQIICVHEFAKERWSSVFIEWELNQEEIPRYNYAPILDFEYEPLVLYSKKWGLDDEALGHILSLGLSVLQETFEARDLEELGDVIRGGIGGDRYLNRNRTWIDDAVGQGGHALFQYREEFYSEYDEPQDTQQEMRFEQDDLLSPPLAWIAFWDGRHSNQIGAYIPRALHRWGYVMWDAERLKDSGAMEYIELEWQCEYGVRCSPEDDDPRQYYISLYQLQLANGIGP